MQCPCQCREACCHAVPLGLFPVPGHVPHACMVCEYKGIHRECAGRECMAETRRSRPSRRELGGATVGGPMSPRPATQRLCRAVPPPPPRGHPSVHRGTIPQRHATYRGCRRCTRRASSTSRRVRRSLHPSPAPSPSGRAPLALARPTPSSASCRCAAALAAGPRCRLCITCMQHCGRRHLQLPQLQMPCHSEHTGMAWRRSPDHVSKQVAWPGASSVSTSAVSCRRSPMESVVIS